MSSEMIVDSSNPVSENLFNPTLSLYIPSINEEMDVDKLKLLFNNKKIGVVSRVDFVFNSKGVRQAFVHFSMWFESDLTKDLQNKIMDPKLNAMVKLDNKVKNNFGNNNIILLPNRCPRELPNMDLINSLQERINQLESKFKELSNKDDQIESNGKRSRSSP